MPYSWTQTGYKDLPPVPESADPKDIAVMDLSGIENIYVGSTEIAAVYAAGQKIWPAVQLRYHAGPRLGRAVNEVTGLRPLLHRG